MAQSFSLPPPSEEAARLEHLLALREAGLNAYPSCFERSHILAAAKGAKADAVVSVAGRLMGKRKMGKLCFAQLKDASGTLQIALSQQELTPDIFAFFVKNFDVGDFIGVTGTMFVTHAGEVSVLVKQYTMLAKALLPLPEKWHGLTDIEQRFRKRYLDLIMNDAVAQRFIIRSKVISALRAFLDSRGFLEIETPTLQSIYGGGFARPFKTHHNALDTDFYLRISDEMYLKRAIVGGFEKVYEITKVFRNEGIDRDHNPEFTMFEAQIAYADYHYGMDLFEEIFEHCSQAALGTMTVFHEATTISLRRPWRRHRLLDAVRTVGEFNFDLSWTVAEAHRALRPRLAPAQQAALETKQSVGEVLAVAFEELVEEKLTVPTIIYDYPTEVSPLAKKSADPRFTQRFEAFALGSEIGNNYSELNDPSDLAQRFIEEKKREAAGFDEAHQTDHDYLEAIRHGMPPVCGLGIGLDRMIMLLTGAANIKEVIMFPTLKPPDRDRAEAV